MVEFKFKISYKNYSYIYKVNACNKLDAWAKANEHIKSKFGNSDLQYEIEYYNINNTTYNIMDQKDNEKVVNFDYQGWPEYKHTIKDLIIAFGGVYNEETKKWEIPDIGNLNTVPRLLEDDGMGYGVNERYIIGVDFDRVAQICNIWHDTKLKYAPIYAELGVYPGAIVKINGKEYTIEDIIVEDQEQGKIKIQTAVWDFQAIEKAHKNKEKYIPNRELFNPEIIEKSIKDDIVNIDSQEIE